MNRQFFFAACGGDLIDFYLKLYSKTPIIRSLPMMVYGYVQYHATCSTSEDAESYAK